MRRLTTDGGHRGLLVQIVSAKRFVWALEDGRSAGPTDANRCVDLPDMGVDTLDDTCVLAFLPLRIVGIVVIGAVSRQISGQGVESSSSCFPQHPSPTSLNVLAHSSVSCNSRVPKRKTMRYFHSAALCDCNEGMVNTGG